ncbi:MAG TPA: response regulator transcription factor [Nocardioidaceae bacterium]|nr:response regulator transcription factor [Nocardioidaceae bacterium]
MPPVGEARESHDVLRVVIGHPMRTWADALERLLAPRWDIEVITAHTKPSWVRNAVIAHQADILLTHAEAPAGDIAERLAGLFEHAPGLGVVVISDSRDRALLNTAIRSGVRGWVEPTASLEHLVRVLHGVSRGETWYPPALMTPVLESLLDEDGARDRQSSALAPLSDRELEILACLAQGLTRREIAERLTLSPHTVRTHINNLLHKLNVHSVLAAVSVARQSGIREWDDRARKRNPV